ncbi:MAG: type III pantothenate kinase [Clostridiales bacterium]|nr:type III pantothenate kinase [Clostridiales bacterium]
MILTLDVGNSNIKIGLYKDEKIIQYARFTTEVGKTSDEYGLLLMNVFSYAGLNKDDVKGVIMASVVPSINYTMEHMIHTFFGIHVITVGPGTKTGMNILYDNPKEVGADRIVTAIAAYEKTNGECIIVDFGTATTFGAVNKNGSFLGGAIMPGIKISVDALVENSAKLPKIELIQPEKAIGRNTITNMQSGIINGFVGAVNNIVSLMKKELGDPKVIATGGLARLIAPLSDCIDEIDGKLALQGLMTVYNRNIDMDEDSK